MTQSTSHNFDFSSAAMTNTGICVYHQPVVPSLNVAPGVAHNSVPVQHGCYPSVVADVPRATYVGPWPLPTTTAPPPQHPFAPQADLHQHHEAGLATGSASTSLPQAPSLSLGQKRVAEDLEDRNTKRIKMDSDGIPLSPETYTRRDTCKRHCNDDRRKLAVGGAPPSHSASYQCSISSTSSLVGVSTGLFTFSVPSISTRTPDSSLPETTLTETTEEATNSDWTDNGIQDPAFVASQSQVREITLAEIHRDIDIWRWINEIEDFEDHVLPISEPLSSVLPEIMLSEAAEDPDVWRLINEIEDFIDPDLPPCECATDAAEDPDFCNYPIRTLLICSWLNNYRSALDQRSPSELAPLYPAFID